ncbi:hypothetical protein D1007_35481 [Hordeum vulgare]|nr:hypothetical protein D1007_35481 [Hordeum vulgare]
MGDTLTHSRRQRDLRLRLAFRRRGHDAVAGCGQRDGLRVMCLVCRVVLLGLAPFFLLALAECGCQRRLVGGLRLLVLVVNDVRGRRRVSWLYSAHAAPALLLVLDRELDLPEGRVGCVHRG